MKTRHEQEYGEQTMYNGAWKIDIFYLHISCSAHQVLTSVLRFLIPYFVLTCHTPFYILYCSSLVFSMQLFPLQSLCSVLCSFTPYYVVCALFSAAHTPSPSSPLHFLVSLIDLPTSESPPCVPSSSPLHFTPHTHCAFSPSSHMLRSQCFPSRPLSSTPHILVTSSPPFPTPLSQPTACVIIQPYSL